MVDVGALQDGKAQIKNAYGTCVESPIVKELKYIDEH